MRVQQDRERSGACAVIAELRRLREAGDRMVADSRHMRDEYGDMDEAVDQWQRVVSESSLFSDDALNGRSR